MFFSAIRSGILIVQIFLYDVFPMSQGNYFL